MPFSQETSVNYSLYLSHSPLLFCLAAERIELSLVYRQISCFVHELG